MSLKVQNGSHITSAQVAKKGKADALPYTEAMRVLLSAEAGQAHSKEVRAELPAIISHWLQSPKENPLVLGAEAGARWRAVLSTYVRAEGNPFPDSSVPVRPPPVNIEFAVVPFPPTEKPKFTFIDLFAGIGGFRLALQGLGGKCVFSSEWEPHAKETYAKNFGEIPFGDIKTFTNEADTLPAFQNSVPTHDILTGGFPCQAFSQAGRQLGFNEARGTLFFEILKIAKAQRPRALILENVKRLKTHDKGNTFSVIVKSLHDLGYKVYAKVLRAYDYGLPQNRERIFIVAFDKPIHFDFPEPIAERQIRKVGDILEEDVDDWYTITDRIYEGHKRRLREHRERGNGYGFSIFKPEAPYTNTISARYWKDGSEILIDQGEKNPRMLTPRECARLQGFPDGFIPNHSRRHAYQQFGNSVPVPVVKKVASAVLEALNINSKVNGMLDPLEPVIY
jgi:DNA (cytosine-5)-methyltransferase 1